MARIIGIDYGTKKVGLATTDPLQIICSPLTTVPTREIFDFLEKYCQSEEVETFVVGDSMNTDGTPSQIAHLVVGFVRNLKKKFPNIAVEMQDERFTSIDARQIILQSGLKKKKRRDKSLVDKVSASLILQRFMDEKNAL
ncbi:MAG: Holliday junction resolvase RuvX [Bacteroidota bacterium]